MYRKNKLNGCVFLKKLIPVLLILLFSLSVILFSGCSPEDAVGGGAVDKTALISLLEDFEKIPKTIDQATLISAYIQIRDNENATQKEVSQAVNGLKELRDTIYATPMSFIDGGLEPHVRKALGFDSDTMITIGDCLGLTELDCSYGEEDTKIRVSYDFRYFPNLTVLDLSGNGVEDLSGFAYLSDLVKLDLSDNPARSSNLNEED